MTDIYFRTDGNSTIATGHLVRCLTIARACAKKGAKVKFIVSDNQSLSLLQECFSIPQEFEIDCLDSDYTDLLAELPMLSALAAQEQTLVGANSISKPWIFVDSYYAVPSYLLSLRYNFRVAYLDDLRNFDCPADLVINYDTDEDCIYYENASRKLLGMRYTPLRDQFHDVPYIVRPTVGHILLSAGGADPYAVAEHLLKAIYHETPYVSPTHPAGASAETVSLPNTQVLQTVHYHILTSNANPRYDALDTFAHNHPTVHIHANVSDVASLFASCDLAVCAGGTTLCELCAVGVPTVSYVMADNQRTAVETYAKAALIPYAGDIRPKSYDACALSNDQPDQLETLPPIDRSVLSTLLSFMTRMSQNLSARTESSQSMRAFLNGTGADQIACELTS
ncbi:MAG: hypothetical protein NC416_15895 [Eubacterium sp.]|nr:hypothetical protein [Eubacterium sp.]